jgi:hypothetical protein
MLAIVAQISPKSQKPFSPSLLGGFLKEKAPTHLSQNN